MPATTVEIPFVQGTQASGDKDAVTEAGKLVTVHNLHVRPEKADVFTLRPGRHTQLRASETGSLQGYRVLTDVC